MNTTTKTTTNTKAAPQVAENKGELTVYSERARLPYYADFKERFGIDQGKWSTLINACYPSARTVAAVVMALDYCKARGLDPFKKPINIVPMYSREANGGKGGYIETIWPGLSEVRTTAHRTREYAGIDPAQYGPDKAFVFERSHQDEAGDWHKQKVEVTAPEWVSHTVYRIVHGARCAFSGPRVYWIESYATVGKSDMPNQMWMDRPRGQVEKVSEVAALRLAFPEEIGNEYTAEEMEGRTLNGPGPTPPTERGNGNGNGNGNGAAAPAIEAKVEPIKEAPKEQAADQPKPDTRPKGKKTPPPATKSAHKVDDPTASTGDTTQVTEGGDDNRTNVRIPEATEQGADNTQPSSDRGEGDVPNDPPSNGELHFQGYVADLKDCATLKALAVIRDDMVSDVTLSDKHKMDLRPHYVEARARLGSPIKDTAPASAPKAESRLAPKSGIPGVTDGKVTDLQASFDWIKEQMISLKGNVDALSSFWEEKVEPIAGASDGFLYKALKELYVFYAK